MPDSIPKKLRKRPLQPADEPRGQQRLRQRSKLGFGFGEPQSNQISPIGLAIQQGNQQDAADARRRQRLEDERKGHWA